MDKCISQPVYQKDDVQLIQNDSICIHDMWNYPVFSFLRLLTLLYTEREKETVIIVSFISLETVVRKTGQIDKTTETMELG